MSAGTHRNFLPDFIPPNPPRQQAFIQFPGFRIPLSDAPPARVDRYPSDRALIDNFFNDIGTEESAFVALAITGLLVPWTPALLGFRVFGRGIGGFVRTAAVSSLTTVYTASYNYGLASLRWKTKDPEITGQDRKVLSFLFSERSRVRRAVLLKADLWQTNRPRKTIPNAHPVIKSWLNKTQWELWRWEACLSILFWTPRVETAWQQVFADDEFCAQTKVNWEAFFEIRRPISQSAPVLAQVLYVPNWYEMTSLPGLSMRKVFWNNSPPKLRDYIRVRHTEKYGGGTCGMWYSTFLSSVAAMQKLEGYARNYLDGAGERDVVMEDAIATSAEEVMTTLTLSLGHVIECEEMNKVMTGKFGVETLNEGSALSNVMRLSKANREIKTLEEVNPVSRGERGIPGNGKVSVDKGSDVLPLAGKEEPPLAPLKETTKETAPAEQVDKSDKRSTGVEVKKNDTDEKRKDETGTGVENS